MKNTDPKNLALNNALLVLGVFTLLYFIFSYIFFSIKLLPLLLIDLILFVFCFFTFRYTIEKFVYEKIKIIYKTIHSLKLPKEQKRRRLIISGDSIDKVNQEVMEWGETKTREIEELKKLASYRREFIGNVSHELKTPIFNIQGYVLTLLDGALKDPHINREYLLRTEKSINRMIAIVEDLEAISRLESGELELEIVDFDLLALTREIIEFLEIKANNRNNMIFFAGHYEKPIMVHGDKDKIRQVMTNLIDNSIKYGKKEDGKTKISFFDMDENYLIEVTDNGVGIAKQDIPRVFERFYRTDKGRSREQGGTGLGLSIVKHIIEAHDQTINIRSTQGVGTTFAFTFSKAKKG